MLDTSIPSLISSLYFKSIKIKQAAFCPSSLPTLPFQIILQYFREFSLASKDTSVCPRAFCLLTPLLAVNACDITSLHAVFTYPSPPVLLTTLPPVSPPFSSSTPSYCLSPLTPPPAFAPLLRHLQVSSLVTSVPSCLSSLLLQHLISLKTILRFLSCFPYPPFCHLLASGSGPLVYFIVGKPM